MSKLEEQIEARLKATLDKVVDASKEKAADIIEEEAIKYYRERFLKKDWDGEPWPEAKHPPKRGSLMYRTGTLMGSVGRHIKNSSRVVIRGGNQKAPYAKIHNEGGTINHPGGERKNTWKKYTRGKHAGKTLFAKNTKDATFSQKNIIQPYTINMPKRQFMGKTSELVTTIRKAIIAELKLK